MAGHNKLNEHGNELAIFASMANRGLPFNMPRAGMIILRENKILLIHRYRFNYDYWVVPGGTYEDGETTEQTAIREIKEETGFKCKIDKKIPPIKLNGVKRNILLRRTDKRTAYSGRAKRKKSRAKSLLFKMGKNFRDKKIKFAAADFEGKNIMLSPKAEKIINNYFNLPFKGLGDIRCPYFNNARRRRTRTIARAHRQRHARRHRGRSENFIRSVSSRFF